MSTALRALRRAAAHHALLSPTTPPTTLPLALERLGFVQADPIRAPARAQDLILRQRVVDYRAGDLERAYAGLPLTEDMIHVYGFVHRRLRGLLHPRRIVRRFDVEETHPRLRRAILDHLLHEGASHPRVIEQALALRHPRAAVVNAWGGQSSVTTRMLDVMHHRGLLQVVRRDRGIRVYALNESLSTAERLAPSKRADGLIELLVRLYAPLPRASLTQLTGMLGERAMARAELRARIEPMIRRGVLRITRVDGIDYLWPAGTNEDDGARGPIVPRVRFLAPFDPLVWDRRRFELLWGWPYRFEAYVTAPKRKLGYYALPLLWQDAADARVVGWVNVRRGLDHALVVEPGYAVKRPAGPVFRAAFDAEVARLEAFLARDEPAA